MLLHTQLLLALHPPVLEPCLDLCLAEIEGGGELHSVGDRKVFLLGKLGLEALQLHLREDRSELSLSLLSVSEAREMVGALEGRFCERGRRECKIS